MKNIIVFCIFSGFLSLCLSGCLVAESTYLKKVDEADGINRELGALKQQHTALAARHDTLVSEHGKLSKEAALLAGDRQTLLKEKELLLRDKAELEKILKAKSDSLSMTITELRQRIAALETENAALEATVRKLKEDAASLQKMKEEKVREVSSTYEKLLLNMKNEISQGQVTISELKGKLTVNMEAAILFDTGRADVKDDGLEILSKMVETLKGVKDKAIRIEGHTDNVQITGALARQFPTNWELSAARATNVVKYLQQQGIDPASLSAAAFAEYRPVADNGDKDGRAKNRRIEITLVARD